MDTKKRWEYCEPLKVDQAALDTANIIDRLVAEALADGDQAQARAEYAARVRAGAKKSAENEAAASAAAIAL